MEGEHEYLAQGTVTLDVSMVVRGDAEKAAFKKLLNMINSYAIKMRQLALENISGEIHTVNVENIDIEWESMTEIEKEDNKENEPRLAREVTRK